MKNLILAAILAFAFAGCTANKPAPVQQSPQEYRHAEQVKDKAGCPHQGMINGGCVGAMQGCPHHGAKAACNGECTGAKGAQQCAQKGDKNGSCAGQCVGAKTEACAQKCANDKECGERCERGANCPHQGMQSASGKTGACPHHAR